METGECLSGSRFKVAPCTHLPGAAARMMLKRSMIDDQLARIHAVGQTVTPDDNRLIEKIVLVSWFDLTSRYREDRAREHAWFAIRSEQLLVASIRAWRRWLQKYRGKAMEQISRDAMADAHR